MNASVSLWEGSARWITTSVMEMQAAEADILTSAIHPPPQNKPYSWAGNGSNAALTGDEKKHPVLRPIIWGLTLPIRSYKSLSFIGRSRPKCLPNHSSFCVQFKWCSHGPVELNPATSYIHVWDVFEGNYVHFSRAKLGLCLLKGFDVVYVLNDVFCVCVSTGSTVVLTS